VLHSAKEPPLPSAALGKASVTVPPAVMETFLRRVTCGTRQSFCRVPEKWHSARHFADPFVADFSLPSATLDKAFAECKRGFA
jgi:hypothetical protein